MMGVLQFSCSKVLISDSVWIGSLGSQGGVKVHSLANAPSTTITLAEFAALWDSSADPLICTNSSVFASWKADLEKLCSDTNKCTYNDLAAVQTASKIIGNVLERHKAALKP
jgi:hypothetical protein